MRKQFGVPINNFNGVGDELWYAIASQDLEKSRPHESKALKKSVKVEMPELFLFLQNSLENNNMFCSAILY